MNIMLALLFFLITIILSSPSSSVEGLIISDVKGSVETFRVFDHLTATFGPMAHSYNVTGLLVQAEPLDLCYKLPLVTLPEGSVLLSQRGNCSFVLKALNAQQYGAIALIVGDDDLVYLDDLVQMTGAVEISDQVVIPSIFITARSFNDIQGHLQSSPDTQFAIMNGIGESYGIEWAYFDTLKITVVLFMLLPGFWCILAVFYVIRRAYHRRVTQRVRVDHAQNMPIIIYKVNENDDSAHENGNGNGNRTDDEETGAATSSNRRFHNSSCPICLEEFDDGMSVKRLPCLHIYHPLCIDPWLNERSDLCPICKHSILVPLENNNNNTTPAGSSSWLHRIRTYRWCPCLRGNDDSFAFALDENHAPRRRSSWEPLDV